MIEPFHWSERRVFPNRLGNWTHNWSSASPGFDVNSTTYRRPLTHFGNETTCRNTIGRYGRSPFLSGTVMPSWLTVSTDRSTSPSSGRTAVISAVAVRVSARPNLVKETNAVLGQCAVADGVCD